MFDNQGLAWLIHENITYIALIRQNNLGIN